MKSGHRLWEQTATCSIFSMLMAQEGTLGRVWTAHLQLYRAELAPGFPHPQPRRWHGKLGTRWPKCAPKPSSWWNDGVQHGGNKRISVLPSPPRSRNFCGDLGTLMALPRH